MSRSGYSDDHDNNWDLIRWRGAVASAIRGKRGQAFLNEMLAAFDVLPEKKLIANELEIEEGAVCALGAVAKVRGIDVKEIDPEDNERVAELFAIPHTLACEIVYMNDEWGSHKQTPEQRYERMRKWVKDQIWDARGCIADPYGKQSGPMMSRYPWWRTAIDWNEI